MVYHKARRYRTTFRKAAFGQAYWNQASLPNQVQVNKYDRKTVLAGWNADGSPVLSGQVPTTIEIIRVPIEFSKRGHI